MRVCVYCASSEHVDRAYHAAASLLGRTLAEHGWRDVVVHELVHDLVVDDPPTFFRSMVQWSAPTRAIAALVDADSLGRAADAFVDVVAAASPAGDRVPFHALLSIGAPA